MGVMAMSMIGAQPKAASDTVTTSKWEGDNCCEVTIENFQKYTTSTMELGLDRSILQSVYPDQSEEVINNIYNNTHALKFESTIPNQTYVADISFKIENLNDDTPLSQGKGKMIYFNGNIKGGYVRMYAYGLGESPYYTQITGSPASDQKSITISEATSRKGTDEYQALQVIGVRDLLQTMINDAAKQAQKKKVPGTKKNQKTDTTDSYDMTPKWSIPRSSMKNGSYTLNLTMKMKKKGKAVKGVKYTVEKKAKGGKKETVKKNATGKIAVKGLKTSKKYKLYITAKKGGKVIQKGTITLSKLKNK